MATAQQFDFSDIAKPLPGTPRGTTPRAAADTGAPDYSHLMDNSKREGTYKMKSSEGHMLQIPYSKVQDAQQSGLEIDASDKGRYDKDFNFAKSNEDPHKWGHRVTSLLPTAGAVVGGILGTPFDLGTGPLGTAAGAALGGAGGKGLEDLANEMMFGDRAKGFSEELKDMAIEGAEQGALDFIGGKFVTPVLSKVAGKLAPTIMKATSPLVKTAADWGIKVLPSEAAGEAPGTVEKFLKNALGSAGKFKKFRAAQREQTEKAVNALADQLGKFTGDRKDLGELVQKAIDTHVENWGKNQKVLYNDIDAIAEHRGLTADTSELKKFAKAELERIEREGRAGGKSQLEPLVKELKSQLEAEDQVPFQAMRDRRSTLLSLARGYGDQALGDKLSGLATKMAGLADNAMVKAAKSLETPLIDKATGKVIRAAEPGFATRVNMANVLTRKEHERFEEELVKKVADTKDPERIVGMISKPDPKSPGGVAVGVNGTKRLMDLLNPTEAGAVRRKIITDAMESAVKRSKKSGAFERVFADHMAQIGDLRGEVIFGAEHWGNIKKLSELMSHIAHPEGLGGAASMHNIAALKNFAMVMAAPLALGRSDPTEGAAALGAEAFALMTLATLYTNPKMAMRAVNALWRASRAARYGIPVAVSLAQSSAEEHRRQVAAQERGEDPTVIDETQPQDMTQPDMTGYGGEINSYAPPDQGAGFQHVETGVLGPDQQLHNLGTNDGQTWYDLDTGQQVQ